MANSVYTIDDLYKKLDDIGVTVPKSTLYRWVRNGMVGKYSSSIGMLVGVDEAYEDLINLYKTKRLRNKENLRLVKGKKERLVKLIGELDDIHTEIESRKIKDEEYSSYIETLQTVRSK